MYMVYGINSVLGGVVSVETGATFCGRCKYYFKCITLIEEIGVNRTEGDVESEEGCLSIMEKSVSCVEGVISIME